MNSPERLVTKKAVKGLAIGFLIGLFGVGGFAYWSAYNQTSDQRNASVKACVRGSGERRDNIRLERDLQGFATDSVKFRKSQGQYALAAKSQAIADRTELRIAHRRSRLVDCEKAFAKPSILPF